MLKLTLLAASVVGSLAYPAAADVQRVTEDTGYGPQYIATHDIVERHRIGSTSADVNRNVTISIPDGYRLISVGTSVGACHYCGFSFVSATQANEISFDDSLLVALRKAARNGFANGKLTYGATGGGSASGDFGYRRFEADLSRTLKFFSATNGKATFNYTLHSKSYQHGAWIKDAQAVLYLEKVPGRQDAQRVLELIEAANEFDGEQDLNEIISEIVSQ